MLRCTSVRIVRFGLALGLSLWIAGAGCVLGCGSMLEASQPSPQPAEPQHAGHVATIVSGDSCPTSKSHDCCAGKKAKKRILTRGIEMSSLALIPSEDGSPGGTMGCPLAVNSAAVITKSNSKQIVSPAAVSAATLPALFHVEQKAALSPPPLLPNRGHTYLRCCVFLI